MKLFLKKYSFLIFLLSCLVTAAQTNYGFQVSSVAEECMEGSAALTVTGLHDTDIVSVSWSTGEINVNSVTNLKSGSYSVRVIIKSLVDTILPFTVKKDRCPVSVGNHFTPNGDGYNDLLQISNVHHHPAFELEIFNKWGQRVHHQKSNYVPWDGKWSGVDVPDGTYYFIFFYNASDKKEFARGDIAILR